MEGGGRRKDERRKEERQKMKRKRDEELESWRGGDAERWERTWHVIDSVAVYVLENVAPSKHMMK